MGNTSVKTPQLENWNIWLQEVENEYNAVLINSHNTKLITEKKTNILNLLKEKTFTKCKKALDEVKQYTTVTQKDELIHKIPGKEKQAEKALLELEYCKQKFLRFYHQYNNLLAFKKEIMNESVLNCVEDCVKKIKQTEEQEMKCCYRTCYDISQNHTLRAIDETLLKFSDNIIEDIKKN